MTGDRIEDRAGPGDGWRAAAVVVAAGLQVGAGAVGGAGLWGEAVGEVARSYPTLLLPPGAAFAIWSLIYVAFAALAVRQALPGQRSRTVHRRSGWWLVVAGVLNATWVLLFAQRFVVPAQVVIVALLACLAVAAVRLRAPADGWADRLLLHLPVAVYLGWVAVAAVAGGATTTAAYGAAPTAPAAITALLFTGAAAAVAVARLPAVAGFAASVCWALGWIASGASVPSVRVAAIAAVLAVVVAVAVRLRRGPDPADVAWG
ncbi:tryptophan-rich sensory protein [Actinophytocola glycyrrhizae]|uniref:Tryptophan-rich sensory protein n=1 Tax=Actinophytocola glycyrrhizae TaxID=2044873 RepID=A0ABV9RT61_9PSEU